MSGVFIWLQILSSVYYGIFLAIAVAVFTPCVMLPRLTGPASADELEDAIRTLTGLAMGALLVVVLTWPYAQPYLGNAEAVGERGTFDVAQFRDRKSTRLNSSHIQKSRMPSSA